MFKESSHQANSIPTCIKTFNKIKINRVPNESCNDIPKQQQQYKKNSSSHKHPTSYCFDYFSVTDYNLRYSKNLSSETGGNFPDLRSPG